MKYNVLLLYMFLIFLTPSFAQDNVIKNLQSESQKADKKIQSASSDKTWKKGILYNLTFSQASLSNWAAGGDKSSLSVGSILNMYANYKKNKNSWDNTFDFNLGYVSSTSLGNRKNDDRFDFVSKYGYAINNKINYAVLVNLRSQFFKGYAYEGGVRTLTSSFMSPGYLLNSIGIDYKPATSTSIFVSPLTARWVFVNEPFLSSKGMYGVDPGKRSTLEVGAYATVNFLKDIAPNIVYKARLDLFSNYRENPQNVDLFMSNILSVKLSKIFTVNWNVDLIYDDDARLFGPLGNSPGLQFKSLVGLGVQFKK
ncbi:MAG: DUF3078 domain-containing protein [bacterium]|jgi:hypothetical protein